MRALFWTMWKSVFQIQGLVGRGWLSLVYPGLWVGDGVGGAFGRRAARRRGVSLFGALMVLVRGLVAVALLRQLAVT